MRPLPSCASLPSPRSRLVRRKLRPRFSAPITHASARVLAFTDSPRPRFAPHGIYLPALPRATPPRLYTAGLITPPSGFSPKFLRLASCMPAGSLLGAGSELVIIPGGISCTAVVGQEQPNPGFLASRIGKSACSLNTNVGSDGFSIYSEEHLEIIRSTGTDAEQTGLAPNYCPSGDG